MAAVGYNSDGASPLAGGAAAVLGQRSDWASPLVDGAAGNGEPPTERLLRCFLVRSSFFLDNLKREKEKNLFPVDLADRKHVLNLPRLTFYCTYFYLASSIVSFYDTYACLSVISEFFQLFDCG
jgi:hypothetical protein